MHIDTPFLGWIGQLNPAELDLLAWRMSGDRDFAPARFAVRTRLIAAQRALVKVE
ncbi:hypothetical protein [Streptomyces sp. NPDC057301]|uniref:hypothetical protein n=1 Tax=Streptomyces sp. NPDC057301 TaxID=3346093 RepID=UPI003638A905